MTPVARTIINIDESDKAWLDQQANAEQLPMTELVRRAVRLYRAQQEARQRPDLAGILDRTSGIWKKGDTLDYQRRLRKEWDRRT
ncbi:hypothetical protein BH24PSE2_BH24PSE2_13470 [soil metagenome]